LHRDYLVASFAAAAWMNSLKAPVVRLAPPTALTLRPEIGFPTISAVAASLNFPCSTMDFLLVASGVTTREVITPLSVVTEN
jgi:hypothetical protein